MSDKIAANRVNTVNKGPAVWSRYDYCCVFFDINMLVFVLCIIVSTPS